MNNVAHTFKRLTLVWYVDPASECVDIAAADFVSALAASPCERPILGLIDQYNEKSFERELVLEALGTYLKNAFGVWLIVFTGTPYLHAELRDVPRDIDCTGIVYEVAVAA